LSDIQQIIPSRALMQSLTHLTRSLYQTLQTFGEGLILQKTKSKYEPGRSEYLYKFKATKSDQEGLVVRITSNVIQLQLPSGALMEVAKLKSDISQFSYSTTTFATTPITKLCIGDVVTFAYDHFTRSEISASPKIIRVRRDISWKDVLADFAHNCSWRAQKVQPFTAKPQGYWRKNLRAMLERFAKIQNFDPLVPVNWYSIRYKTVLESKELTHAALAYYNGSFTKALIDVFPEIGLEESNFSFLQKGYWHSVGNRIKLFNSFANKRRFDPLFPHNWYSISSEDLRSFKGFVSMLRYYNGSVVKALLHLFPNIGLNVAGFPTKLQGFLVKETQLSKKNQTIDHQFSGDVWTKSKVLQHVTAL